MPGLSATVGEEIEALRRIAGEKAVCADPPRARSGIAKIVSGWARNFDASAQLRSASLRKPSFDEILRVHVEDELGGKIG